MIYGTIGYLDITARALVKYDLNKNNREVCMTKGELIEFISKEASISKTDANNALNAVISGITKTVKKGNKVTLIGFGTFSLSKRAARTGRNPRTGEHLKIKASRSVRFSAGKALKSAL